jgi:hypothetical protein
MDGAEALGEEDVERFSQHLARPVTEDHLSGMVEEENTVIRIYGDDRIHRRSDNARKTGLAVAELRFRDLVGFFSVFISHGRHEPSFF